MYIFIVNPTAGNGRGAKVFKQMKDSPIYTTLETLEFITTYEGHARKITQEIDVITNKEKIVAIVVIGGDGTINEVVNGLSHHHIPISFIPAGSGNDFYRGANLPKKPTTILKNIVQNNEVKPYWFGRAALQEQNKSFVNCIGFGFDAYVVKRANRSALKKSLNKLGIGRFIYIFSFMRELLLFKPFKVTVKTDETTRTFEKCFLLTINNQPYFGGGMKINPLAENNPDYFSLLVVDSISKWKVFFLFITVFFEKHIHFKEVQIYRTRQIMIETATKTLYQMDGEIGEASHCAIKKEPFPLTVKGSK